MISRKIIAIGGGEIGRPIDSKDPSKGNYPIETRLIDEEIIRLTGKTHPKALLLPTASGDSPGYYETFEKYYGKILGCQTEALLLKREKHSYEEIKKTIMDSDIIYVGGGNTLTMLKRWRKLGVDKILAEAYEKGKVLCGVSAGSICWFDYGQSDSWRTKKNPNAPFIKVRGLGLISALHAPHFMREPQRHSDLKQIMKRTAGVGVALEDFCALEVIDDRYRIISSKPAAMAYKCFWKAGKYYQEPIAKLKEFSDLSELVKK
jgi:dipeptidase E